MSRLGADGAWWLSRSSKPLRPDDVGLGGFDSHTFPPRRAGWRVALAVLAAVLLGTPNARAQNADSTRVGATAPVASDTVPAPKQPLKPPVSSKRALLQSLAVPGWGQASLHCSTAGGFFAALEVASIAMLIQSKKELAAAKQLARDSVLAPAGAGGYVANPYAAVIPARKQAVEDWSALLIFTHLISGADAFVAAQLWDVPIQVHGQSGAQEASIMVTVPF